MNPHHLGARTSEEKMPTKSFPSQHTSQDKRQPQLPLVKGAPIGLTLLMADDDSDDCLLAQEAWEEIQSGNELRFVHDGEEVLDFVFHGGLYATDQSAPRPDLILLDLNMPKKNGHEVLGIIKADADFQTIPIVIFTTTKHHDEIIRAYNEGANAFLTKPTSFEGYCHTLQAIDRFWFQAVQLPSLSIPF